MADDDEDTRMSLYQSLVWINTVYFVVWVVLTIYLKGEGIKTYAIKLTIASLPFLTYNLLVMLFILWSYKREQRRVNSVI
uniref:9 kDa protein n=1 Tax=Persimmon virus B TaxID=1493829 RepID=A0A0A8JBW0_9CLOS|nr:9 kDa protein [Persimmon virus B]